MTSPLEAIRYEDGTTSDDVKFITKTKEGTMYDVKIGFSFESEEEHLGPEFAANVIAGAVRDALRAAGFDRIERGIGVRVTPRGAQVNAPTEVAA